MSTSEIKGLFFTPSGRYMPMGLNIIQKLWWRFVPGVVAETTRGHDEAWFIDLARRMIDILRITK